MMLSAQEIGRRLTKLRKARGQPKTFVARQLGISYSGICAYEYGLRIPSDRMKVRIADFYGVSVESIFYAE